MSANFEYKPITNTTLDDAQKALEELRAEVGISSESVKEELSTVGGSSEQVNEDYQLEDTLNGVTTKNETTDSDLEVMFGSDWDGKFTDMTGFVETVAQDMASQMQYNSSLTNYLSNNKTQLIDDVSRRCGLAAIKEQNTQIQNNFNALTSGFTNFKTFGFSSGSGDLLGSADSALQNVENIIIHTKATMMPAPPKMRAIYRLSIRDSMSRRSERGFSSPFVCLFSAIVEAIFL